MIGSSSFIFSIGQVSRLVKVKEHTIRFWQSNFSNIKHKLGKGGRKYYNREAVNQFCQINYLMKDCGMRIAGIKKIILGSSDDMKKFNIPESIYPNEKTLDYVLKNKQYKSENSSIEKYNEIDEIIIKIEDIIKKMK